jgi:hypothetical protein
MADWSRRVLIVAFCVLTAAAPGAAAQLINVGPGDGRGGGIVVSTGSSSSDCIHLVYTCAPGVAVSGVGAADGDTAIALDGSSDGAILAVSGIGDAKSSSIAVSTVGSAKAPLLAVSLVGTADCGGAHHCYAISGTGNANSPNGTAVGGCHYLTSNEMGAMCGIGAYNTAYWDVWDLMG